MKKITCISVFFIFLSISYSQSVVWSDNFDDLDISDWTLFDYDADGSNWAPTTATYNCVGSILGDASKKIKPNNFITSPLINLSEVSTTSHLKWEEFILHSNFTKYYEVIITEQNDINSILTAAVTPVYNGNPTTLVPNRTLKSVQIPSTFLGKKIYVTFRHHQPNNTTGTGILFIDNVSIETTLSLSKQDNQKLLTVYPNPTNGIVNLEVNKRINRIEVVNIVGKTVMKIEAFEGNKINIEHLNSGLYIINFFIDNKTIIKKVIKQNP